MNLSNYVLRKLFCNFVNEKRILQNAERLKQITACIAPLMQKYCSRWVNFITMRECNIIRKELFSMYMTVSSAENFFTY